MDYYVSQSSVIILYAERAVTNGTPQVFVVFWQVVEIKVPVPARAVSKECVTVGVGVAVWWSVLGPCCP